VGNSKKDKDFGFCHKNQIKKLIMNDLEIYELFIIFKILANRPRLHAVKFHFNRKP